MRFEYTEIWGIENALRGMRNPMKSWNKSDSAINTKTGIFVIGKEDLKLAQTLIKAGTEHRKFMRQIFVSVDITAPLYWWKEFDTYKVGTTANSTSTMHKIASEPITMSDFELSDYKEMTVLDDYHLVGDFAVTIVNGLEALRQKYVSTKDMTYWKELIRWLPESWLQTRTVTMNYENILTITKQRKGHKLSEWRTFVTWAYALPYAKELLNIDLSEQTDSTHNGNQS